MFLVREYKTSAAAVEEQCFGDDVRGVEGANAE